MGLQDVYFQLRLSFDSPEARALSAKIQEEIYFHALTASCELAQALGPHAAFQETRAAQGNFNSTCGASLHRTHNVGSRYASA